MDIDHHPIVSFVLATHNRREVVRHALTQTADCGLEPREYEILVVDNASQDGTPDAIEGLADTVLRLNRNRGSCAKDYAIARARGRYIMFLDDDSYPRPGSMRRMMARFEEEPRLGAAGFTVHLPSGAKEASALPGVSVGAGVGFRAEALRGIGGLDRSFFMQAEELDLSFRLVAAGWNVKVFSDLHVEHLKTEQARRTDRITYCDVRNNLRVVSRYLPAPYLDIYLRDWRQRYLWLAEREGHDEACRRGLRAGRWLGFLERRTHRRFRLSPDSLEQFFRWGYVRQRMAALIEGGVRRIVFVDLGKNIFAFHRSAREVGIESSAIGDDRFAAPGRYYRGIPVVSLNEALASPCDACVVGNSSAPHAAATYHAVAARTDKPVHCWFGLEPAQGNGDDSHSPNRPVFTDVPEAMTACGTRP